MRYGAPSAAGRCCPGGARRTARGGDDRPQRGDLSADLAALLLALLLPRRHLRARQRHHRRLDRGAGFVRVPVPSDRVDHVWMVETLAAFSTSCSSATTSFWSPTSTRSSRRCPSGGRSTTISTASTRSSSTPRLRDPASPGPRAAARPCAPDPRPARLLVRQRRLRQAGAGNRADAMGPGLPRERRRSPNYDPDLRLIHLHRMDYEICLARHRTAPCAPGTSATSTRMGRVQPARGGEEFDAGSSTRFGFERGDPHRAGSPIPACWRGLF